MKAATFPEVFHEVKVAISIHAAREGGDVFGFDDSRTFFVISIHAAREGGDYHGGITRFRPDYFNPRRP